MEFATRPAEDSKASTPSAPAVVLTLKAGGDYALPLLRRRGGDSKEFPSNDNGLSSKCAVISETQKRLDFLAMAFVASRYLRQAEKLALAIQLHMPDIPIAIVTDAQARRFSMKQYDYGLFCLAHAEGR